MTRTTQLLFAFLLLAQALPVADATHGLPEPERVRLPDIPEEEAYPTGIVPLDRLQRNATRDANGTLDPARGALDGLQGTANETAASLPGRLTLFEDTLDATGRHGGYGDYAQPLGAAWGVTADSDPRLTVGTRERGWYPGNTQSLLVLPELDLRTGFADPVLAGGPAAGTLDPVSVGPGVPTGLSAVHRFLVQALDLVNAECYVAPLPGAQGAPPCTPGPAGPQRDIDMQPREGLYVLEFDRRMNLARNGADAGRDGLQMLVFTQRPDPADLDGCVPIRDFGVEARSIGSLGVWATRTGTPREAPCTIVEALDRAPLPDSGVRRVGPGMKPTAAFGGADAYTGFDAWRRVAIDLTPWAERQVWVAFLFASGSASGEAYFGSPNMFTPGHGFYGVELDDFELNTPGMPHSVRVRPIHEPWYRPYQHEERPTVPAGPDLRVAAVVANVGTTPVRVPLSVRLLDRDAPGAPAVWQQDLGTVDLGVGDRYTVDVAIPGVTVEGRQYTAVVDATGSSDPNDLPEADPRDSLAAQDIDVVTVKHLVVAPIVRLAPTASAGDHVAFTLPLRNDGNAAMDTVVRADLINTLSGGIVQGAIPSAQALRTLTVQPGGEAVTEVAWSFPVEDAGQYRLFVRVDDERPFDAERDLKPISLQPRSIPFLDGDLVPLPLVDGTLSAGEWPASSLRHVVLKDLNTDAYSVPGRVLAAANADTLYLAAQVNYNIPLPTAPPVGADRLDFLLDIGGDQPVNVTAKVQTTAEATPSDLLTAEAAVPFSSLPGIGPGSTVRLLVAYSDYFHPSATDPPYLQGLARYPPAPLQDGEGFRDPDGSLRDETSSWAALRLGAPQVAEPLRLLSLGVGVDRAPPPVLEVDASDCSDLDGWTQSFMRNPPRVGTVGNPRSGIKGYSPDGIKWMCAPYGEDGRVRLYEGRSPRATCNGAPCAANNGIPGIDAGFWGDASHQSQRRNNFLTSPPIDIPNIAEPYLLLRHQYSTETYVVDEGLGGETGTLTDAGYGYGQSLSVRSIQVPQKARVYMEELGADGNWTNRVLLRPLGGYSSEDSVGLTDPGRPARRMDRNVAWVYDGWWWPTGHHPHYRPPGEPYVAGATFDGSPWTVDRIPLFGSGHGAEEPPATPVDAAGKTIRLLFSIQNARSDENRLGHPNAPDYGWRIEGLAVAEGPQFASDVAVVDVEPVASLYDPGALGLGPGTPLTVNVTIANRGTEPVEAVRLCVRAVDTDATSPAPDPCAGDHGERDGPVQLQPGASIELPTTLTVPPREGARVAFLAGAYLPTGDDFPADNQLANATVLEVRRSPNLAVEIGTDLPTAGTDQSRSLFLRVVNRGNVPVADFTVARSVSFEDGSVGGTPVLGPDEWRPAPGAAPIPIGASVPLDALAMAPAVVPTVDLRMPAVPRSGLYSFVASVRTAHDIDRMDDQAGMTLRTRDRLAAQTFSGAGAAGLPTTGPEGLWTVAGGSLFAGDPSTGEVPLRADGTIELTQQPIDLRSAREAVLTLRHRYDLEAAGQGFDAGRVEVSTDGVDWRPLRPVQSPLQGLPDGYPSVALTGDSALAAETLADTAVAFTGRSADLPGAEEGGWIRSQFDFAQDPRLSRRTAFDDFGLAGLSSRPAQRPVAGPDGAPGYRAADWTLPEPNAEGRLRYWWIDNRTDQPVPHGGSRMWWSGSAGVQGDGQQLRIVHTRLERAFTAPGVPAGRNEALVTWWQWRAGDADGGTGAWSNATLHDAGGNRLDRQPVVLERDAATGWSRLGIPLGAPAGQALTLRFDYDSAYRGRFPAPLEGNNRGWFIDDVQLVAVRHDVRRQARYDEVALEPAQGFEDGVPPGWSATVVPGTPVRHETLWSLVERGPASPGAWHVAPVTVPGLGEVPGWRFADGSSQGYPHLADARLVTPLIDLGQASGELRLAFDQQYWFESEMVCPTDEPVAPTAALRAEDGCFRRAIDAGAIEYQVYDVGTRTFGAWQPLAKGFDDFPARLFFDARTDDCHAPGNHVPTQGTNSDPDPAYDGPCTNHRRWPDRLTDLPGNRLHADYGGYPALEPRGLSIEGLHGPPHATNGLDATYGGKLGGLLEHPYGHGTSLAAPAEALTRTQIEMAGHTCQGSCGVTEYLRPWASAPMSFAFSGASPGPDGWSSEAWDVSPLAGRQVRFAFHAVSNPSLQVEDGRPADPDQRGWSLANIRVEGDTLDGKPVRVRLRLSTDSTLGAGEWRIDEATVSGQRFHDNAAVLADGPTTLVGDRGEGVRFTGGVRVLGGQPLEGIVAVLTAVRESDLQPYDGDIELRFAPGLANPVTIPPRPGLVAAHRLKPLDLELQPSVPLELDVQLPEADDAVLLRWSLLQEQAGGLVPFPLDVPGNAEAVWTARALRDPRVAIVAPLAGNDALIVATPGNPLPGDEVSVQTLVRNVGTTTPELQARAQVWRVLHKGGSATMQPGAGAERLDGPLLSRVMPLPQTAPGESAPITFTFKPTLAGLYRIRVTAESTTGDDFDVTEKELLVGLSPTYLAVDFAAQDAQAAGWRDVSPAMTPTGGGTPGGLGWRDVGDRFLWGVTEAQYGGGSTYCPTATDCHGAAATSPQGQTKEPPAPPPHVGLDGRARGPPASLDRVPEGKAFLTLRHSHAFEADDGARVEFLPLEAGSDEPAFPTDSRWCPGGVTYTFDASSQDLAGKARSAFSRPLPGRPSMQTDPGYPGEHAPARVNPLNQLDDDEMPHLLTQRVIGGPPASFATLRFDLSMPARAACPVATAAGTAPETLQLLNYTLVPILRTGTRPGYLTQVPEHAPDLRQGGQGWAIHSLQISSLSLALGPDDPVFPVQAGAAKTFFVTVTNAGQAPDRVTFRLDPTRTSLPTGEAWVTLPADADIEPGETLRLPVRVLVPATAQPGTYVAAVEGRSTTDPLAGDSLIARIPVRRVPLPDLAVSLQADGDGTHQAGTIVPVHATVFNVGLAASRPTQLVLQTLDAGGNVTASQALAVPPLCPPAGTECAGPTKSTLTFEWPVPAQTGAYRLRARVDAANAMDEVSEANNIVDLDAPVSPLSQPDLAITALDIAGAPAGFAEEGTLVTITAKAKNVGDATAENVRIKLRYGSSTLKEHREATLAPGQEVVLSVAKVVSRGDFIVAASASHSAPDANLADDDLRRPLRVRGHEVALAADAQGLGVAPGGTLPVTLTVRNHGNSVERVAIALDPAAAGWSLRVLPNPVTVAPGRDATASLELTAPAGAAAGPQVLRLIGTPSGHAPSAALLDLQVSVAARADAPRLAAANHSMAPGAGLLAVNVTSTANLPQRVLLAVERAGWGGAPVEVRLAAGEAARALLPLSVPADAPVGRHVLNVTARDGNGTLLRVLPVPLDVLPRAAVEAAWQGAVRQDASEPGLRRATFTLRVTNTGNVPLTPEVRLGDLGEGHAAEPAPPAPRLRPGEHWLAPLVLRLQPDVAEAYGVAEVWLPDGNASLRAAARPLPSLDAAPDLHVATLHLTPRGVLSSGGTAQVRASVHNAGGLESPASVLFVAVNGLVVAPLDIPPLAPGASTDVVANVTFTKPGRYLVSAVADGPGEVEELQDADNSRTVPLEVAEVRLADRIKSVPSASAWLALACLAACALAARRRRA